MLKNSFQVKTRAFARLGAAGLVSALAVSGAVVATGPASATPRTPTGIEVLLYGDPLYVDASVEEDESHEDGELENLRQVLTAAGNTVSTVDTTSAAAFRAALAGKDVFGLTEIEPVDEAPEFDAETIEVFQDWVADGGTFLTFYDTDANVNDIFGFSVEPDEAPGSWDLTAAPGRTFVGGPASLWDNSATSAVATDTLPAGAIPVYADADSGTTTVYDAPYGKGNVVALGWDWYGALGNGEEGDPDLGWNDVLQRAVETGRPAPVRPPAVTKATAPGKVARLRVKGKARASARRVVWAAPVRDGGAPIAGYRVVVTQKGRTVVAKKVGPGTRQLVVRSRKLAKAKKATVRVRAINKAGAGAWSTVTIRTIKR